MPAAITYDDTALQALFEDMEPKRRLQALKGGFRREAGKVRKTAVANLRSSGIRTDADLEKGVRAQVFKNTAGFRITVGTSGKKGYHVNRQGLLKPVLLWAETGTKERKTKGNGRRRALRLRASHPTGRMPRYAFMERTASQVKGSVTDDLHTLITESVVKTARKYGCR